MNTRNLLSIAAIAVVASANANFDQISNTGGLFSNPGFGVAQIFGDFADFSGTNIDDFNSDGIVVRASMAFELSDPSIFSTLGNRIQGWRVSFWDTVADAGNSGNGLNLNTSNGGTATGLFTSSTATISYSTIVAGTIFRVDVSNISIATGAGLKWMGMAPVMDFSGNGQLFIYSNATPLNRGGGAANDSWGVNPGDGFGLGTTIFNGTDAAYAATSVPELATMIALGAGLAAFAARSRRQ